MYRERTHCGRHPKWLVSTQEAVFAGRITLPCSQTRCKGRKSIFVWLEAIAFLSGPTANRKTIQKSLKTRLGRHLTPKMEFLVPRQNSISPTNLLRYKWSCLSDEQSLWRMLRNRVSPVHKLAARNRINPTRVSNLLSMALCLTIVFDFTVILFFLSHPLWKPGDVIHKRVIK